MKLALRTATTLALFFVLPAAALADEIIVDPRGFGDVTTLQAGVDAAQENDVLLVRPGAYDGDVLIDGKGLVVVAQVADAARVVGSMDVRNIGASQLVVLHGLDVRGVTDPNVDEQRPALAVTACAGEVRVERCALVGADGSRFGSLAVGGAGALLDDAQRFVARRSTFRGGLGVDQMVNECTGGDGGIGLLAEGSRAALYGCTSQGGDGMSCQFNFGEGPGDGGAGLALAASEVFVTGGLVRGGAGGDIGDFIAFPAGDGGDGLVGGPMSRSVIVDVTTAGGARGESFAGPNGSPGQAISGGGAVRMLPGRSEHHDMQIFVRGQSLQSIEVRGEPGAEAVLYFAARAPFFFDVAGRAGVPGVFDAGPLGMPAIPLGTIPASGVLQTALAVPAVPPGATTFPLEFVITTRAGAARSVFGSPMHAVVVQCANLQPDCNGNGSADLCELLGGAADCDVDGVLDACQADCNGNGVADTCDIASGTSDDGNGNGVPDECEPSGATWFVDAAAASGGDGSFGAPFRTIAEAFAIGLNGDEVVLFDGTYRGAENRDLDFNGRGFTVRSMNGASACTMDLESAGRAFYFFNQPADAFVRIEGLTIRRGAAPVGPGSGDGGAIHTRNGAVEIVDCVFEMNNAGRGGALRISGAAGGPRVVGCTFQSNTASLGGAIYAPATGGEVEDCRFVDNVATSTGGALLIGGSPTSPFLVSRSEFLTNGSDFAGGAIGISGGLGGGGDINFVSQCLFAGNAAATGGAIGGAGFGRTVVQNCTFVGNEALDEGGACGLEFSVDLLLENSILRGNIAPVGAQCSVRSSNSQLELAWCNLEGGVAGVFEVDGGTVGSSVSILDADPLFQDPAGLDGNPMTFSDNDYRLGAGSPSVDAGDNGAIPLDRTDVDGDRDRTEAVPVDLDGGARRVDDGTVPDTGSGAAPIVDHGPYERS